MRDISSIEKQLQEATTIVENSKCNTEINSVVENIIKEITDAEYASIWMYDKQNLRRERSKNDSVVISMSDKKGLLYQCFAKKEQGIYNYLTSEKGYVAEVDNPDNIRIKSKIMIPLTEGDRFLGVVTAYSTIKKIKKFTQEDLKLFEAILPFIKRSILRREINARENSMVSVTIDEKVVENLHEIQEANLEKKASDEMLNFVSNIVHDIRTPANGLLGFLDILQEQIKDERLKEYVAHARDSAQLINELTTSILDGVSEKKEPELKEKTTINTTKYFSNIADIFSANMSQKDISYNIFIDPLLPKEIELNSLKVKRVIMNLISNASKFTPEHGCIEFSVRYKEKEKKLHFYVKDNGIGIAKEKQEDIFEAFKQAEDNTKDLYGGTGLGLAICAAYVKEMGGKLSIDSELDEGSVFYFDIPMEIKDYAKKFTPIKNEDAKITVLMKKDDLCTTNHIARYLVKMGMNVDNIKAVTTLSQVSEDTTHLMTFESKLEGEVFSFVKKIRCKHLVIEEKFLSLDIDNMDGAQLVSKYSDMGETLYTFVNVAAMPKVLLVEDDQITITLLKMLLRDEYCSIDTANDGREGLESLTIALKSGKPYDIVYSDQKMPHMNGEEMLAAYRDEESERNIVAVSVSGDELSQSNRALFDVFANKPFKKDVILKAFAKAVKK